MSHTKKGVLPEGGSGNTPCLGLAHTLYPRASSFYAYANCECSFSLSVKSGEEPPTSFSDRGTLVHQLISGKIDPATCEADLVEEAGALEAKRIDFFAHYLGSGSDPINLVREQRLWVRNGLKPIYSGTPDVWARVGKIACLSDYKTSWHPLDDFVATNAQIRAYAALIHFDSGSQLEGLYAAIHKPGSQPEPAFFDQDALDDALNWAKAIATFQIANHQNSTGSPSRGPWCKFCPGKVLCPAWHEEMKSLSQLSASTLDDLPDSQLRKLAPHLALAAQVIDRLTQRLRSRVAARPDLFPDWHFEPGTPKRKISDPAAAYTALVEISPLLSSAQFLATCRIPITVLETTLRANSNLTTRQIASLLDSLDLVKRVQDAPKLIYNPQNPP